MITHAFVTVNFLPVYDTKHLKIKVKKFEANSLVRIDEFQRLKASFVMFCSLNALKSLEKRSNFVLEKSGKLQSDFCMNPGHEALSCDKKPIALKLRAAYRDVN